MSTAAQRTFVFPPQRKRKALRMGDLTAVAPNWDALLRRMGMTEAFVIERISSQTQSMEMVRSWARKFRHKRFVPEAVLLEMHYRGYISDYEMEGE